MKQKELLQSLKDADIPAPTVQRILTSMDQNEPRQALQQIRQQRCVLVEAWHESGRKIDVLDQLIRQTEQEMEKENRK
ncbi:MAG: hypothetical protein J6D18_04940 [Erysipelotrichaceae bacterium]|nr:hypothetical protein [Erysipelotrichaceae bacterium]